MSSSTLLLAFLCVFLSVGGAQELIVRPVQSLHTKALGTAIVLTCILPEGEIRWYDGKGNEITARTGRLFVENENSQTLKLYIVSIENQDAGKYSCQGKIGDNEQRKDVTLQLFEDITFADFPLTQNPIINEDALIACSVKGVPTPTVSWRYNGRRLYEDLHYSVSNSSGLIIRNITKADDGVYVCRGEVEVDGRYTEKHITVEVHIPPKVTSLESLEVVQDATMSLKCEADGLPKPTFEFFKDGDVSLVSSEVLTVNSENGSLSFTSIQKSDDGNYTCRAVNRVGSDSAIGQIRVLVKPSISKFSDVVGVKGNHSTLICIAEGYPVPTLSFSREGSGEEFQLGTSENERYTVSSIEPGQLQLVVHSLRLEDAGKYSCSASSKIGSDSKTASIAVQFEPSFVTGNETVYIWAGKVLNLTCEPSGEPTPEILWMHSNTILENNETFHVYSVDRRSVLQIRVGEADQSWIYGSYSCQATNSLGDASRTIEMKRAATPDSPQDVKVTKKLATSIEMEVKPPADDGGIPVTGYKVEYGVRIQKTAAVVEEVVSSDVNQTEVVDETIYPTTASVTFLTFESSDKNIHIVDLKANTTYLFKVRARNEVGLGNPFELTGATIPYYPTTTTSSSTVPSTTSVEESATSVAVTTDGGGEENRAASHASDNSVASTQQAAAGMGVVIGAVFAVFLIVLVIVDVSCYFVNGCGVTSFLCVKICKRTRSKEKALEEGESDIIKQPLPDDENVASVQEMEVEKFNGKDHETKLNQSPEDKDEFLKKPSEDEMHLENPKVAAVAADEVPFAKEDDTSAVV